MVQKNRNVVVIGAGPSGLAAGYKLTKEGVRCTVIEKGQLVGGISKTVQHKGYYFDLGGHRFFTKVAKVNKLWHEVLGSDFMKRPRLSRIYYNRKFFDYPIKPLNALTGLGPVESARILASYVKARFFPYPVEDNFEQWISNRFGKRLYEIFFKTYTEKVWGIPCTEIKAEWAAQRIKGLSLTSAVMNAIYKPKGKTIRTLIDEFEYPKHGPGMMWEKMREYISNQNKVMLNSPVTKIRVEGNRALSVTVENGKKELDVYGTDFISSMPLRELVNSIKPEPPKRILDAANALSYRDFLTVALIVNQKDIFPDNWIYIHSPDVEVGRIQNFKNWSPYMVPDKNKTCIGMEYFCSEGDNVWNSRDEELVELARNEIETVGLAESKYVEEGVVVRTEKAYPVYDDNYVRNIETIKSYINGFENLQTIGRNGMHRYNNMDHSMLTALLAVENLSGKTHDLWTVNTEQEYHEEQKTG